MSLYGALFTGVTGLNAQSQAIAMISDNLANVNTVGYKRTTARFATLVTRSGNNNVYSPGGVRSNPLALVGEQGQLSTTQSDLDSAITGGGFFVVNTQTDSSGETLYTRAGSFLPDQVGNLRNTAGYLLQGWPLDANGAIPAASADLTSLQTVNVSSVSGVASASSTVSIGTNLDANETVFGGAYSTGDLASGTVTPNFFRNFIVYDSLGAPHELTAGYLKTGINTWSTEVYAANSADLQAPTTNPIATGDLIFNGDASLDADNAGSTIGTYNATTGELSTTLAINWANGATANSTVLNWGTNDQNDGLTQFQSNYNVSFVNQNGAAVGLLNGVSIDDNGFVVASFTNGETQNLYKLPLATFADPTALNSREGNAYAETNLSGSFNLREAATGGAGKFVNSALESSNVDIGREFTDMIITQRAYSANTRVITTVDQMLDELIRLIR